MTFEEFKRKYRHHYLRAHATGYQKAYEELGRDRAARERPQTIDNWQLFPQRSRGDAPRWQTNGRR